MSQANDYRIEKDRLPVVLVTTGGERLAGELFVQTHARYRSGPEEAPDLMNDDEPFFPFAVAGGDTLLIAKDHVREVEVPHGHSSMPEEDDGVSGLRRALIELTLSDGSIAAGAVYLEVQVNRPRLLDFLNRYDRRFVTLYANGAARLVNRRLIERVRPLD